MEQKTREEMLPKKITWFYKLRNTLRKITGFQEGSRFILDVKPKIKEYSDIELMRIATIEEKLQKVISENHASVSIQTGIQKKEAESLLEWTVQNARKEFTKDTEEKLEDKSLQGWCGFGQGVTATTLKNMGLSPYIINANPALSKQAYRHAFVVVTIPIEKEDKVEEKLYLIDTTFKQFFLRDEVSNPHGDYIKDRRFGNKVAGLEGYWMLQMKNGKQFATELLENGFIELTEENAKMYGDSFALTGKIRKNPTKVPTKKELLTGIEGKEYIQNITSEQMQEKIGYDDKELEEKWHVNVTTPLMNKMKSINNKTILQEKSKEIEQKQEENLR